MVNLKIAFANFLTVCYRTPAAQTALHKGEKKMKSYTLKSIGKNTDYMTILREMEDGFVVKIVRDMDGYEDVKTDYISRELFDSCIRTGYLTEITETVKMAANA